MGTSRKNVPVVGQLHIGFSEAAETSHYLCYDWLKQAEMSRNRVNTLRICDKTDTGPCEQVFQVQNWTGPKLDWSRVNGVKPDARGPLRDFKFYVCLKNGAVYIYGLVIYLEK